VSSPFVAQPGVDVAKAIPFRLSYNEFRNYAAVSYAFQSTLAATHLQSEMKKVLPSRCRSRNMDNRKTNQMSQIADIEEWVEQVVAEGKEIVADELRWSEMIFRGPLPRRPS
jgi:hypothetical protein